MVSAPMIVPDFSVLLCEMSPGIYLGPALSFFNQRLWVLPALKRTVNAASVIRRALSSASCQLGVVPSLNRRRAALVRFSSSNATIESALPASKRFNFIADAAEIAAPAVAYIEVAVDVSPPFGGTQQVAGAGSGFVVTDYGVVLTNAHVINRASSVKVKLRSGEECNGDVIDVDPIADLAVVQINSKEKLRTLQMGNSSAVRPGEWVVALGTPLNLSNTVTAGIVSAVHRGGRDIGLKKGDMKYIQTDAPINRGNSGGPLINLDGQVIGINTMTLLNTTGISFAVPIDRAKAFLLQALEKQDLRKSGKRVPSQGPRPYIGLKMMTLVPEIEHQLRQQFVKFPDVSYGVLVVDVIHGSPAFRSGLRPYDVIIEADGVHTSTSDNLFDFVARGREFTVSVIRGSTGEKLSLRLHPIMVDK